MLKTPTMQIVETHPVWGPAEQRAIQKCRDAGTEGRLPTQKNLLRLLNKTEEIWESCWIAIRERHHGASEPTNCLIGYWLGLGVDSLFGESDPEYPGTILHPEVGAKWEKVIRRLSEITKPSEDCRSWLNRYIVAIKEAIKNGFNPLI